MHTHKALKPCECRKQILWVSALSSLCLALFSHELDYRRKFRLQLSFRVVFAGTIRLIRKHFIDLYRFSFHSQ